ncbi:hypothetical protein ACI2T3_23570, partial [Ralstonia nicotianae]
GWYWVGIGLVLGWYWVGIGLVLGWYWVGIGLLLDGLWGWGFVVHPGFRPLPGPTYFLCLAKESRQRKARPRWRLPLEFL